MLGHGCNAPLFGRHASVIHAIIVHKPLAVHAIRLWILGRQRYVFAIVHAMSVAVLDIRHVIGRTPRLFILC